MRVTCTRKSHMHAVRVCVYDYAGPYTYAGNVIQANLLSRAPSAQPMMVMMVLVLMMVMMIWFMIVSVAVVYQRGVGMHVCTLLGNSLRQKHGLRLWLRKLSVGVCRFLGCLGGRFRPRAARIGAANL